MATLRRGGQSQVAFGEEATWGTAVARTIFAEVISSALKYEKAFEPAESVFSFDQLRDIPGKKSVAGSIPLELHYSGYGFLFKHLMGDASVSTVALSGADTGAFEHTITPKVDPPVGLTIEEAIGDKAHVFAGCRLQGLTLALEADQQLHAEFAVLGRDEDSVGAVTAPTFPAENPVLFDQMTFSINSTPVLITSGETSFANGLREDGRFVNSRFPRKFDREGRRELTGSFTTDYDSDIDSIYTDFRDETFRDLAWVWDSGALVVGGGAENFELSVTIPKARLTGETPEIAEGVVPVTIGWSALKSASPLWTIFLRNDVATL